MEPISTTLDHALAFVREISKIGRKHTRCDLDSWHSASQGPSKAGCRMRRQTGTRPYRSPRDLLFLSAAMDALVAYRSESEGEDDVRPQRVHEELESDSEDERADSNDAFGSIVRSPRSDRWHRHRASRQAPHQT